MKTFTMLLVGTVLSGSAWAKEKCSVTFAMFASCPVHPPTPDIRLIVRYSSDGLEPDFLQFMSEA